jgi:hypothetical protein
MDPLLRKGSGPAESSFAPSSRGGGTDGAPGGRQAESPANPLMKCADFRLALRVPNTAHGKGLGGVHPATTRRLAGASNRCRASRNVPRNERTANERAATGLRSRILSRLSRVWNFRTGLRSMSLRRMRARCARAVFVQETWPVFELLCKNDGRRGRARCRSRRSERAPSPVGLVVSLPDRGARGEAIRGAESARKHLSPKKSLAASRGLPRVRMA